MNHYQSRGNLKNTAKEYLTGKFGSAILLLILFEIIGFASSFLLAFVSTFVTTFITLATSAINEAAFTAILYVISSICSVFVGVFNAGVAFFYLNIACGQRYSISDLFYGFCNNFGKSLAISAAMILPELICMIPYEVFSYRYQHNPSMESALLMIFFVAVGLAVSIPITLSLSMSFYLMLDFPQYSAEEILKLSMRVMKGNKWRLFCLEFSFLPLMLLGLLSMGIGFLWLTPYMNMTYALFFLDLMKPKENV